MNRIVYIDRDGTLNEEVNYLYRKEDLRFTKKAEMAIRALNDHGFLVVVVTNQAGVARGYYTEEDVQALHRYINECLKESGAHIDDFYYCPHHPQHGVGIYQTECSCRKPETGMLELAGKKYDIDKRHSYMIGDNKGDILAGRRFGVTTVLVETGYGQQVRGELEGICDYYAADLYAAVQWIIKGEQL